MDTSRKIVWSEGMLLTPQHFQQWDQYYEKLLTERLRTSSPFGWGAMSLDIDRDGLVNGRFTLLGFRGVMPDGLVVRMPDQDAPPQTRPVGESFLPSMEQLDVYLGIPVERSGTVNCRLDDGPGARPSRYTAEYRSCFDTNSGENPREVLVARKNLRIFFSGEEAADTVALKIAELIRTPSGAIGLRDGYIPSCLSISASPHLMKLLRGLIELVAAKRSSFANPQRSVIEIVGMDLAKYSLVFTLATHMPLLTHFNSHAEKVHPETLYLALARLAGQLTILSLPSDPQELPLYDHDNLSHTFGELDRQIRVIIEGVTPTRYVTIQLEGSGENVWAGRVPDNRLFASSQFFLVAAGDMAEDQIRTLVPQHIKVGSPTKLKEIVAAAMPGVRLYHTFRPPATLPVKIGHQYFRLEDRGVFWDEIKHTQVVALHVPENLQSLRIQLLAAKE